jgi:hypothetical protein
VWVERQIDRQIGHVSSALSSLPGSRMIALAHMLRPTRNVLTREKERLDKREEGKQAGLNEGKEVSKI